MTEAEWLTAAEPYPMLQFLRDKASKRKLRLFAVACCRQLWDQLEDYYRRTVDIGEQYADGHIGIQELRASRSAINLVAFPAGEEPYSVRPETHAFVVWCVGLERDYPQLICRSIHRLMSTPDGDRATHCKLLRCIFGNPFRPVTVNPSWLTATVVSLATAIYDERAFDRMPVLGDALEDAGCDNADMLNHCRHRGVHVRGCWLLDLLR